VPSFHPGVAERPDYIAADSGSDDVLSAARFEAT
jgi:hypothetical protein